MSAVIRCRDRASTITLAIESVRRQSSPVEVVIVDSGSRDGSVDIARRLADRVLEIRPEDFTFGGAINAGCLAASGSILITLSAHCHLPDPGWVERALRHFDHDSRLAGVFGAPIDSSGQALSVPRPVSFSDVEVDPYWGFSNHAGIWRRAAWEEVQFDPELSSCEDRIWMWDCMQRGWIFVADPTLVVSTDHRRSAGLRALWQREYAEHRAIASHLARPVTPVPELCRAWWSEFPYPGRRPKWIRRMSPMRLTEYLAGYLGERRGYSERSPHALVPPRIVRAEASEAGRAQ